MQNKCGELIHEERHDLVSYFVYDSGLSEMIFHTNTKEAVNHFQTYIEHMFETHTKSQKPYFVLVDATGQNQLPLRHIFVTSRAINRIYPHVPHGGRAVYLFERTPAATTLDVFLSVMRGTTERRFMEPKQRNQAIDWLLQGITNYKAKHD